MRKYPVLYLVIILMLMALACNVGPFGSDEETATEEPATADQVVEAAATEPPAPTATPEPPDTPTPEPSPEPQSADELMQASGQAMDNVESFHLTMDMQLEVVAEGMTLEIPVTFEGDVLAPDSSAGTISISFFGMSMDSEFVSVDGTTYMTNPETGAWEMSTDEGLFGLGDIGGGFASPDALLDADEDAFNDLEVVGEETLNGVPVIHLQGTMIIEDLEGEGDFTVDIWVGAEDNYIYQLIIEGQTTMEGMGDALFDIGGGEVAMLITMTLSNYNEPVQIEIPEVDPVTIDTDETFYFGNAIQSVAFLPDGSFVASGGNDGNIGLWDVDNPSSDPIIFPGHSDWIRSVAASPDGNMLASGSDDQTIMVWGVDGIETPIATLEGHEDWVRSVAFSPDSLMLASGGDDYTVRLWNTQDFDADPAILDTDGFVFSVAFSPDGNYLAAGGNEGTIYLWDLFNLAAEPQKLEGHADWIRSVAFSPDGSYLASGSDDQSVSLWNMADMSAEPMSLLGHTDWVRSVAFSADGSTLASGSDDMTILVWDMDNLTDVPFTLLGHTGWVTSVAFDPVDDSIVSGSEDGTVRLWYSETPGEFIILGAE
jgi:WD40 repeat protein